MRHIAYAVSLIALFSSYLPTKAASAPDDWQVVTSEMGGDEGDEPVATCEARHVAYNRLPLTLRFPFGSSKVHIIIEPSGNRYTSAYLDSFKRAAFEIFETSVADGHTAASFSFAGNFSAHGFEGNFHLVINGRDKVIEAVATEGAAKLIFPDNDTVGWGSVFGSRLSSAIRDCLDRNESAEKRALATAQQAALTEKVDMVFYRENYPSMYGVKRAAEFCRQFTNDFTYEDMEKIDFIYSEMKARLGVSDEVIQAQENMMALQVNASLANADPSTCAQTRLDFHVFIEGMNQKVRSSQQ